MELVNLQCPTHSYSFATVSEGEIYDAVISRSDAASIDVVLPILKVGSRTKFSDYRPISLLVCLSKVLKM
jgi:hypothetical protein